MKKKRLFFVGIPTRYVKPTIERAQQHGFEVIIGDTEKNLKEKAHLIAGADQQVLTDLTNYEDLSSVTQRLYQEAPLDAMCTFKEPGSDVVARVAQAYNLKGNSTDAIDACVDKFKTHYLLKKNDLLTPRSALCTTLEEIQAFWKTINGPVVIKPNDMQASIGVTKVWQHDALETAFRIARTQCPESQVLIEEMLIGREISIEAMVYHGDAVLFGVTEKHLYPGMVIECGHISPDSGQEMTRQEYQQLVQCLIKALGITHGPLHIEGFHTANGFVLTDIHTRYGGDFIVTLTELAMKCDMTTPVFTDLAEVPYEITFGTPQQVAGVRFLDVKPGVIQSIEGLDEVRNLPGVFTVELEYKPGDTVKPLLSSFDRVGCVVAQAATREELDAIFQQAFHLLHIVTA